jgi:DnaK suppressor protein
LSTEKYNLLLQAEERRLLKSIDRADANARDLRDGPSIGDWSDASVSDEEKEGQFQEAENDSTLLNQVREALKRIEDGTFGKCMVDGGLIEEKRLNAMPWTPYCLKHEQLLEKERPVRMPTL